MKKKLIMLLVMSSLLSACDSSSIVFPSLTKGLPLSKRIPLLKNENYIKPDDKNYIELDYSNYTEKITSEDIITKANNKDSFVVYFYSLGCHLCNEVKPLILKYICETKYIFNSLEINDSGDTIFYVSTVLKEYFLNDFNEDKFGTPKFYFFLEGKLIADTGLTTNQRNDYHLLKDLLNSYVKSKEI